MKVNAFRRSYLRGASVAYCAPEALIRLRNRIDEDDPRIWKATDIYSLALTLCEMLIRTDSPWSRK